MKTDRIRLQVSKARTHAVNALHAARQADASTAELAEFTEGPRCDDEQAGQTAADLFDAANELQEAANGLTVLATRIICRCQHG